MLDVSVCWMLEKDTHTLDDKSSVNQCSELRFPSGQKVKGRVRRVIFPAHLQSVCFRSPSNSSLEPFSVLLFPSLILSATPSPLPHPFTHNPTISLFNPDFPFCLWLIYLPTLSDPCSFFLSPSFSLPSSPPATFHHISSHTHSLLGLRFLSVLVAVPLP